MYGLPERKGSQSGVLKVLVCSTGRKDLLWGIYESKTHSSLTTLKRQGMRNKEQGASQHAEEKLSLFIGLLCANYSLT